MPSSKLTIVPSRSKKILNLLTARGANDDGDDDDDDDADADADDDDDDDAEGDDSDRVVSELLGAIQLSARSSRKE
jgi:hypothetical protein